jgi:hypothetical protein
VLPILVIGVKLIILTSAENSVTASASHNEVVSSVGPTKLVIAFVAPYIVVTGSTKQDVIASMPIQAV